MPLIEKPKIQVPQDTDLFPFGLHKNKPYGSIPAKYFDYIIDQSWIHKWPQVVAYIEANKKVIDEELLDEEYDRSRYD